MKMKIKIGLRDSRHEGSALLLTAIMAAVALAMLAAALSWSSTSTRLTYRSVQYSRSEAAAEAATEKVVSQITGDFLYYGESQVFNHLNSYKNLVPSTSDSTYWSTWQFSDASGNLAQTYVQRGISANYQWMNPPYSQLKAF